jgi:hypothetical protein
MPTSTAAPITILGYQKSPIASSETTDEAM